MSIALAYGMAQSSKQPIVKAAEQNFQAILRGFDRAMLVTHGPNQPPHARPMQIAEVGEDGSLWFITGQDTQKVDELKQDTSLVAIMQSSSRWLSVSGHAEVQRDRAHVRRLWKEAYKIWFKDAEDPNIVLIRFDPSEAEYWDNSGLQGVKLALKAAAAFVTGKELRDDGDVKTHAKVQL